MPLIRFRNFPVDISRNWMIELTEIASGANVEVTEDLDTFVDLEFTGPYGKPSDEYSTPFNSRLKRLAYIKLTKGHHLSKRKLSAGIQPNKKAKSNIWYTGENQRPPFGDWDGYIGFDALLKSPRSVYLPLWILASTNLLVSNKFTYWEQSAPDINDLLRKRALKLNRKKFCCSFIGKTYSERLNALEALSSINQVDVYGTSTRNQKPFPGNIASNYRFCLCFENDIYPGYVTEKPVEAYIAGTIPLYFGYDIASYLNQEAIINLLNFESIFEWRDYVHSVHSSNKLYRYHYEQPLLLKKPDLTDVVNLIKNALV